MTDLRTIEAWRDIHQPFELNWWKEHIAQGHLTDPGWTLFWDDVRAFIEPHGRTIDIGCGPRPPFAPCYAIDPLILEYKAITPGKWWAGVIAYSDPAEDLIPSLRGKGDTIVCWNCLDHTVGWKQILDNMLAYGAPNARFAIATDFHEPFVGHPGYPRTEFDAEIDKRFHIHKRRRQRPGHHDRDLSLLMTARV